VANGRILQTARAGWGFGHRLRSIGDAHFVTSEIVSGRCPSLSDPTTFVQSRASDDDMGFGPDRTALILMSPRKTERDHPSIDKKEW
jgi:hypothetical protein